METFRNRDKKLYRENKEKKVHNKFDNKLGITTEPGQVNELTEVPRKQNFIENKYSLNDEMNNVICYNDLEDQNIYTIDYLMMKDNFPIEYNVSQYSNTNLKTGNHHQSDKRIKVNPRKVNGLIKNPRKQDFIERRHSQEKERITGVFLNESTDPKINTTNYLMMENNLPTGNSFTQYNNTNLKPNEYIDEKSVSEAAFPQSMRACNICKKKHLCLSSLPTYYAELIPKPSNSRPSSPLSHLQRKESNFYNRANKIQDCCKYSTSQNSSLGPQMKHETFSEINCAKKNKNDQNENITYFINHLETRPFTIGQIYSTNSQNGGTKSELQLINKKPKTAATMFCGMKSEPEPTNKSQLCGEIDHVMKNQNCEALLCNNSFPNVHKEYPGLIKTELKSKAYYDAINYTQSLIQKLSEKSTRKMEEEQLNSQINLSNSSCSCEEKCTQTFSAVPNKKTKNLIYKEKITQTIR
ncbi:uncharacterized protein [Halyomorpha halys]|uniref:uncharacterized protein isoform X2 n=1 Tax=Halyomorpha halys TaxID=286706 RepID=UPI0006D4DA86|nr:uncharacterized protein LOC106686668 isoform X2 [Halyomorpha halys]